MVFGGLIVAVVVDKIQSVNNMKRLIEIDDCPFKFKVKGNYQIVIQLTEDAMLWCDYALGVRSDGLFGIDKIRLLGINEPYGGIHNLKIGQSVFPIIKAVDEFVEWASKKPFKTEFKEGFDKEWVNMKKNLDNLRYLEAEAKKKEKKTK